MVVIIKVWYPTSWVKGLGRIERVVTTVTAVILFSKFNRLYIMTPSCAAWPLDSRSVN